MPKVKYFRNSAFKIHTMNDSYEINTNIYA